ncbi:MAG: hypothetical protein ACTSYD_11690 [Candidatus Heimdallarchaeaceae archaeon]
MSIIDWFVNLPPKSLEDNGLKMLIYLLSVFVLLTALIVYLNTRHLKRKEPQISAIDLDFETESPISSQIPPEERIAILNIEKSKYIAAQKALNEAHRKKEISDNIFSRLSVRYASDVKQIEEEIEKTTREVEVSKLEQELKAMQGDYISRIKGEEKPETPVSPTPPTPTPTPTPPTPTPTATPPTPTPTPTATPPTPTPAPPTPPSTVTKPAPTTAVPKPPIPSMPTVQPKPQGTPAIPTPATPTPKPPTTEQSSDEGDLFAKSTSIAALRKEMLKELDRLKKFMREQQ